MSTQRKQDDDERRQAQSRLGDAGTEGAAGRPPRPGEHGGDIKRERLDTIEWADDRTQALDPQGGFGDDPIDDLLDGAESDATYREEARRVTPTLGPASDSELDR